MQLVLYQSVQGMLWVILEEISVETTIKNIDKVSGNKLSFFSIYFGFPTDTILKPRPIEYQSTIVLQISKKQANSF